MEKARAAVYEGPGKIVVREFPLPQIGEDGMLLEVEVAGVDGSDIKIVHGDYPQLNQLAPLVMGDEVVGRVIKAGEKALQTHRVKIGDRVTVEAKIPCYRCRYCLGGNYYLCSKGWPNHGYGWTPLSKVPSLWGSYATHLYVPSDALVHKIPRDLPPDIAIIAISNLANGIHWVRRAKVMIGDSVVVIGPGPQGLSSACVARESGAKVVIVAGLSKDAKRLEMAKKLGADYTVDVEKENLSEKVAELTQNEMADVVIECVGNSEALNMALDVVRIGGTINHMGVSGTKKLPLLAQVIIDKELTLLGSLAHPYTVKPAIELASKIWQQKKYPLGEMVTHRYSLAQAEESLKAAAYELPGIEPVKTVIDISLG